MESVNDDENADTSRGLCFFLVVSLILGSSLGLTLLLVLLLSLAQSGWAQASSDLSNTTLQSETRNNTSANDEFQGMANGNPTPSHVSKLPLRSLMYPGATTKIYARVVPFFLKTQTHVNVGYDSGDPRQVERQVEDMLSHGIDGAVIDWYGRDFPDLGRASFAFREASEKRPGFSFVISADKGALRSVLGNWVVT